MKHSPLDPFELATCDIERFVRERFQIPSGDTHFTRSINLWEEGYVDSLGVVEVLAFLEQRFLVKLPEEVVFSPEFTSIDEIARFIVGLRAGLNRTQYSPSSDENSALPR
jgi:acyl carrier protein